MSAAAPFDPGGGNNRVFTGDDEDAKEYRRWKIWTANKLLTLSDKVPATARGAYVYTLLGGKALEAVEHLEPSSYQKEGGEKVLFELLDRRFPQKEASDELSENLTRIFELRAHEGESLKSWVSRASEAFDNLQRKTNVSFPEEARGWLILHRSGLNAEQVAVVLARSLGVLKREEVGKAMRSCYPNFSAPKRRVASAALVSEETLLADMLEDDENGQEPSFEDVELLLADDTTADDGEPDDVFDERDIKETLAVTWQEKRKSLARLQKDRKFHDAGHLRRQFRVEVEELKRRTRCHKCGQVGHWSKECRNSSKGSKGKGKGHGKAPATSSESGAALVEHFVAMVIPELTLLQRVRALHSPLARDPPQELLLVSSPGYGILDSGCGRSIVGEDTLSEFRELWKAQGFVDPEPIQELNHFRFGNGAQETSHQVIPMPVVLGGRCGVIKAALVKGRAPLLISRKALMTLQAKIDFQKAELTLFSDEVKVPLQTNTAGQFIVNLLGDKTPHEASFEEVMETHVVPPAEQPPHDAPESDSPPAAQPPVDEPLTPGHLSIWSRIDDGLRFAPLTGKQGPSWNQVVRRRVTDFVSGEVILDQQIEHHKGKNQYHTLIPPQHVRVKTEFFFRPQEKMCPTECLPVHHLRQLRAQVKCTSACPATMIKGRRFVVAEVFSPPRFAPVAQEFGFHATSYDLITGYDFTKKEHRDLVREELDISPPDLLVLCPPCTHEGGWWHLNAAKLPPHLVLKLRMRSRMFIKFCLELFEQQVSKGRFAMFEHPLGSQVWTLPDMKKLLNQFYSTKLHMCRYGMKMPDHDCFIRKPTRLLISHRTMESLGLVCPGKQHPQHECHDVIAGSAVGVGSISKFAGQYPPAFVESVLRTIPAFARVWEASLVQCEDESFSHVVEECLAAHREDLTQPEVEDARVSGALIKLHKNLGHPSNTDLVRILRHGQASQKAIAMARDLVCDFCKAHIKPHVPLPAQSGRITQFNQLVGVDVKYLPGWLPNQKIKSVNMVDQGSCFQQIVPFFEQETSMLLGKIFAEAWVRWAGPPESVIVDPAQTMLGEAFQSYLESMGTHCKVIAAEAHWQLGRTENHGGWFGRILQKMIDEHSPSNKEEWLECVGHARVKNQSIQSYGFTPFQHVFGKNPNLPGDLMSEPLHIVPATVGLHDEAIARAQAMRRSARMAVVALQDDKAVRAAMSGRPRVVMEFKAGELVAYWRQQKVIQGTVQQGGRWHGTAVVIGMVGRNVIVAHRKQIFRCAPEQLRPATSEERTMIESPEAELLGIKDLIEGGTFKSKQYIDLVPSEYPPSGIELPDPSGRPVASQAHESAEPSQDAGPFETSSPGSNVDMHAIKSHDAEEHESESQIKDRAVEPYVNPKSLPYVPEEESSYGPVRRRVSTKSQSSSLFRPPAMQADDFSELMKDLVPSLIENAISSEQGTSSSSASSAAGVKRDREDDVTPVEEPPAHRARNVDSEVLSVEEVTEAWNDGIETLIAAHIQKKLSKELPPHGNPPELQALVDESKVAEWGTLEEKTAIKIHYGKKAQELKRRFPDRFIGSRFVIIRKAAEEGIAIDPLNPSTYRVKSRWCLQGHLDPDLDEKASTGLLQSPTLSQMSRMLIMQVLASYGWVLQLGDIKGAFMVNFLRNSGLCSHPCPKVESPECQLML